MANGWTRGRVGVVVDDLFAGKEPHHARNGVVVDGYNCSSAPGGHTLPKVRDALAN